MNELKEKMKEAKEEFDTIDVLFDLDNPLPLGETILYRAQGVKGIEKPDTLLYELGYVRRLK